MNNVVHHGVRHKPRYTFKNKFFIRLVITMADKEGITEQLKVADQMAWVGAMNNIRNRADVVVLFLSVKTGLFICIIL